VFLIDRKNLMEVDFSIWILRRGGSIICLGNIHVSHPSMMGVSYWCSNFELLQFHHPTSRVQIF